MLEAGKVVTVCAEPAMAGDTHNWIASNDKTKHNKNLFTSPLLITISIFSDRIKITVSVQDLFFHVNENIKKLFPPRHS